jgi:hypothetical protein
MERLRRAGPDRHDPTAMPVVALVHNEANILPDFLRHYRAICRPSFLIVDDRSDDGGAELLAGEPDVTLFRPARGSTYARDKAAWRSELLDAHAAGRWALVPDIDEHFVWWGMEQTPLAALLAALEAEGAEAVATLMVDMYADRPLAEHVHRAGDGPLAAAFPLFDGPESYAMRRISRGAARRFPCPPVVFLGGARERLFYPRPAPGPLAARAIARFHRLDRPLAPGPAERAAQTLSRIVLGRTLSAGLNATKLGLVRWRTGLRFAGGAHKIDARLTVSDAIAAFLHFPFTRGRAGLEYVAARGQHASGGGYYAHMLAAGDVLARSPVCRWTRRYSGSVSLAGLLRPGPGAGP